MPARDGADMNSPICPFCGSSLVRLGISREKATRHDYEGEEFLFCCQGCLDGFLADPAQYVAEVSDWVVCPTCLAEKPKQLTVSIDHKGREVLFCRCPCCVEEFLRQPADLLAKLAL